MNPPLRLRLRRAIGALRGQKVIAVTQDAAELRTEIDRILNRSVFEIQNATEHLRTGCGAVNEAVAEMRGPVQQLIQFDQFRGLSDDLNELTVFLRDRKLLTTGESPVKVAIRLIEKGLP